MTKQNRRLGRGLAALIGDMTADQPQATEHAQPIMVAGTRDIPLAAITPNPTQPRTQFDPTKLQELAESIRISGVIQPIVVRPHGETYQLVAGERRWRAAQQAGLTSIPAVIRDATDQQMVEFALIENVQREDLNPIDRARAYAECCQRFALSAQQLAEDLGEDRTTVTNYIRLLDLPPSLHQLVRDQALSMGHARCLLGLSDVTHMEQLARQSITEGLSVRQLEALVRDEKVASTSAPQKAKPEPRPVRPLVHALEDRFRQTLQTHVAIREGRKKNTGRIVIEYYSVDDFGRIAEKLGIPLEDF